MKKILSGLLLTAVILAVSAPAMNAQDRHFEARDLRHDYVSIDNLRANVAADQARLNQDLRYHRWNAVRADREILARDQQRLDFMRHDAAHDRAEMYWRR